MNEYHYQIGGSLTVDAPTYVERKADRQLYQSLKAGEFCYVLDSRQMGKSSLLVRTFHRLQTEGYQCSAIDLTRVGSENITPTQWYKGMVAELWRGFNLFGQVNLKSWWRDEEEVSLLSRLSHFIEDVLLVKFPQQKIFIFVDEIDSILGLSFSVDDFFALIRFCYNQRAINPEYKRLTFAIFGVATPSDLIADKNRTPFNIGTAIALEGFTLAEAEPLAKGLAENVENYQKILQEILNWTSGQPFLTQKLCDIIVKTAGTSTRDRLKLPPGSEAFWVENLVRSQIIYNWEAQDEPEHLKTIRDRLLRNKQKAGRLLGIYQKVLQNLESDSYPPILRDDSREQIELILSGLAIKREGLLAVKTQIYQEIFNREWVEKQLRDLRPYSQSFEAWIASDKTDESRLLRGLALKDAQYWGQGKSLTDEDYHYLAASAELDAREIQQALEAERVKEVEARLAEERKRLVLEREIAKGQRQLIGVLSGALMVAIASSAMALRQYYHAAQSEIEALTSSSQGQFASQQRLDALVSAIKARRKLDRLPLSNPQLHDRVRQTLQQAIYGSAEFNRLVGHSSPILSVDVSPDAQLIATGGGDRTAKLWKPDGTLLHTLEHAVGSVYALHFTPDSQHLVTSTVDGTIYLWNREGKLVKSFQAHNAAIWAIAISPDLSAIASGSEDGTIRLWTLDGKLLNTLSGHQSSVWGVAFSPDGKLIASSSLDGTVKLWTLDGKLVRTLEGHKAAVWDVKFALLSDKNGRKRPTILSASGDKTVKLWQPDGTLLATLSGHTSEVLEVALSTAGDAIASVSADKTINLWTPDGTLLKTLKGHQSGVRSVTFMPDSPTIVSASDDNTARFWNPTNPFSKVLYGHSGIIWNVHFSPDGKAIASASSDGSFKLWARDGTLLKTFLSGKTAIYAVAFLSGANWGKDKNAIAANPYRLASASGDNTIQFWQWDGTLLKTLSAHQAAVLDVSASPDGRFLASTSDDKTVKLWNLDRMGDEPWRTFIGHQARVYDADFTPDGKRLVSVSSDGTVRLWSLDGQFSQTLEAHRTPIWQVAIHPDGSTLATASRDDAIKLWSMDGMLLKTIRGNMRGIMGVDFSPDGEMLVGGGSSGAVKLWKTDGTEIMTLIGHEGNVWTVRFSPDGKQIASAGDDRTVILWDVERILQLDELAYACDRIRDYLRTNSTLAVDDRQLCQGIGE